VESRAQDARSLSSTEQRRPSEGIAGAPSGAGAASAASLAQAAFGHLVTAPAIQRKPIISSPRGSYEREAEEVTRGAPLTVQREASADGDTADTATDTTSPSPSPTPSGCKGPDCDSLGRTYRTFSSWGAARQYLFSACGKAAEKIDVEITTPAPRGPCADVLGSSQQTYIERQMQVTIGYITRCPCCDPSNNQSEVFYVEVTCPWRRTSEQPAGGGDG
jgi:hypothetical protein